MSCAERRDRLYDRLYGLLDEGDAAELDRHVASCPECRREWEALKGRDALLDEWTPVYRPTATVRFGTPRRAPALAWAAAALLITLATTLLFPASTSYEIVNDDVASSLAPGTPVKAKAGGSIRLGRAGRVLLEPGAELVYRRGGPGRDHELELAAGTAHFEVFPTGRAFKVAVGERTVEVHGTRFTVQRLGVQELGAALGEDSMKRWNLASVSIALVTVTSGTVVLTGPDGRHSVDAGVSLLATPAGVERVGGGESLASVRKYRDELLRAVAAREGKNRAARSELDALKTKSRKAELPPGATLESLIAVLRAAVAKGDPAELAEAVAMLGLLLEKEPATFDGVMKALGEARDATFAGYLCSALWQDSGGRVISRRSDVLKLFLAPGIPNDIRLVIVRNLGTAFYSTATVSESEAAQLLRAAQALAAESGEGVELRATFATIAVRGVSTGAEAWGEFQRYLAAETDEGTRMSALQTFFYGATRRKGSTAAEGLLLDTLRGKYGAPAASVQVQGPLLAWFTAENAESFVGVFRQAAAQFPDPRERQSVAGQLGLLHLIQRTPAAIEALRQLHSAESDPDARSRMNDVLQAADKGTLDLDQLMEKLQLGWNF